LRGWAVGRPVSDRRTLSLLVVLVALTAGCGLGPAGPGTDTAGDASSPTNASATADPTTSPLPGAGEFPYAPRWRQVGPTDPAGIVDAAEAFFGRERYRATLTAAVRNRDEPEEDSRLRLRSVLVNGADARYESGGVGDGDRSFGGAQYVARTGSLAGVVYSRTTVFGITGGDSADGQAALDATDEESDPQPASTAVLYAAVGSYRSASVVERNGTAMVQYRNDGVDGEAAQRFDLASNALLGFAEGDEATFAPEQFRGTVAVDRHGRVRRVNLSVVRTLAGEDGNVTVAMNLSYRLTEVGAATAPRPDWVAETPVVRAHRVDDPAYDRPVVAVEHVAGPPVRPSEDADGVHVRVLPRATDGEFLSADYYDASVTLPPGTTLGPDTTLYVYGSGTAEQAAVSVNERPDPAAVAPLEFAFRVRGPAVVAVEPGEDEPGTYTAAVTDAGE
jgi:hypothetical protein